MDVADELASFAVVILGIAGSVLVALLASRLLARLPLPIPEPAIFLDSCREAPGLTAHFQFAFGIVQQRF